ncbi:hypothetical protein OT109_06285 [Phycisphaeraceae bacterium D3-23]
MREVESVFKCKQCGRQFGANTPKACPGCGSSEQAEREKRGELRIGILDLFGDAGCFLILLIALVVCFFGTLNWIFGWF